MAGINPSNYDITTLTNLDSQYLQNIIAATNGGSTTASGSLLALQQTLNNEIRPNLANIQGASLQTVTQQQKLLNIVNNEKNRLTTKESALQDALSSKRRAIELNESYRKKQQYYTYILIVVVFAIALCVVALTFLPESIKDLTLILIIAVAVIIIMKFLYAVGMRDNINFDKLHSISPVTPANTELNKQNKKNGSQLLQSIQCIGSDCCPSGSSYSTLLNQCVFFPETRPADTKKYNPASGEFEDSCPSGTTEQADDTLGYKVCMANESFSSMGTASSAQPYTPFEFNSYSRL